MRSSSCAKTPCAFAVKARMRVSYIGRSRVKASICDIAFTTKNTTRAERKRITESTARERGKRSRSRRVTNGWRANDRKSAKKNMTNRTLPAQRSPTTAAVASTTSARERKTPLPPGFAPVEKVPVEKMPEFDSTAASV